jgi:DNA-binding transcriptional MerR regulator
MTTGMRVGEVARKSGISVRTLHHYDEIGLIVPQRTESGYRVYDDDEIALLQEVLFYRELGFPLDEIAALVSTPDHDRGDALRRQRDLVRRKIARTERLLEAIERSINAHETGVAMTKDEMLDVFGDFDPSEHAAEARERWGDTEAYATSMRRTASYTREDWEEVLRRMQTVNEAFLSLMADEVAPESERAMDVAEQHRAAISDSFYECTVDIHEGLGRMYVADPRFTRNIDKAGEGLAAYMSRAIIANAARLRSG